MQTRVFDDFDAFAASVRDVDSKMMLRNVERRLWTIRSVDLDGIDVQLGRLGSGNIAEGQLRPDGQMLYLPLSNEVEYVANGTSLPRGSFAILEPGCEFCISTEVAHDWCAVFVPNSMLPIADEVDQPAPHTMRPTTRVTRPNYDAAERFWSCAREVMKAAAHCAAFESSSAASCAKAELLRVTKHVMTGKQPARRPANGRPGFPRDQVVRRSKEALERLVDPPVRVSDLAAAAGVSERTLRRAFKDYYGVGPVRYLQLRHLNQIHLALKLADPVETSVTDVLVRYGEWEFGRFAGRYRRLFGELPTETLRKRPK